MDTAPPVFLVTGVPGSGKTALCRALLRRFAFGLHLPVDDLRELVVSGTAHPVPEWTEETGRQFELARAAAGRMAQLYREAGFAVAIDDVLGPAEASPFDLPTEPRKVLLRPSLEAALERNRSRSNKAFDAAVLDPVIRHLYASQDVQAYLEQGWQVLDTTHMTVEEAVGAVLAQG